MKLLEILHKKRLDELRTICRKLNIKGYSNLNKSETVDLLIKNEQLVETYLKPTFLEKLREYSGLIGVTGVILGALYFIFNLYLQNKVDIISKDKVIVPVTIIKSFQNEYQSLSNISVFEPYAEKFSNYQFSLQTIDYPFESVNFYEGLEKELNIDFPDLGIRKDSIVLNSIYLLENCFWHWMTFFPQEYAILDLHRKESIIGESFSGKSEDWKSPNLKFVPVISNTNKLLNYHKIGLQLPKKGILYNKKNNFKINTSTCEIRISFRNKGGQSMNYGSSNFVTKVYKIFKLPKEKRYLSEELEIEMTYIRKNVIFKSTLAQKELNWYLRLKENLIRDFSFDLLKHKLNEIE